MQRIAVRGLVRLATRVRQALSGPVSPSGLASAREMVQSGVETVDAMLADYRTTAAALPAPSRRAYAYLTSLDLDAMPTSEDTPPAAAPPQHRFPGSRSHLDRLLDRTARGNGPGEVGSLHEEIVATRDNLVACMERTEASIERFKPESRNFFAWFAYFADASCFEQYVTSLRTASAIFETAVQGGSRFVSPVVVHFRPIRGLYRVRGSRRESRVYLPTAMVTFTAEDLTALSRCIFGREGNKEDVIRRTQRESYVTVRRALEDLGGSTDSTAGVFHDLAASFQRVNATYFDGRMPQPTLRWSKRVTGRKFRHYDSHADCVEVSSTLDAARVDSYVVDFLVYHELLHKKHGGVWQNGRRRMHTPAFRRDERRFREYDAAEAALRKLATRFR